MYGHFPFVPNLKFSRVLLIFMPMCFTQFQLPLLALQTDNGQEFDNHALHLHLSSHGVSLRLSCPYTSAQNGKAECIIHTMNNCVRSLLLQASMPEPYWVEALNTSTHLLNHRPCKTSGTITPYQMLLGMPPSYSHLKVFGCLCFPNRSATVPNKLSARSTPCMFLGYPTDHKVYRCLDLQFAVSLPPDTLSLMSLNFHLLRRAPQLLS